MWFVYFLKLSYNSIYVGSTNNIDIRVKSHKEGQVQSTKAYLPVYLKYYVAVETKNHARELEKYFKSGSGKAIALKRLIKK